MEEIVEKMLSMVNFQEFKQTLKLTVGKKHTAERFNDEYIMDWLIAWANAKKNFFKLFGEKLFLIKKINIAMTLDEGIVYMDELMNGYPKYACILKQIEPMELVDNRFSNAIETKFLGRYFPKTFKLGANVSRSLSKLCQDEEFDIYLSTFLQNRKNEGYCVLSIHPVDFAMLATSKHEWGSCMDLVTGFNKSGCYSLMMDNVTTVAYEDRGNFVEYTNEGYTIKWNNKMFRYLVYIPDDTERIVFGHRIGSPPDSAMDHIVDLIADKTGKKYKKLGYTESYIKKAGELYYNTENTGEYKTDVKVEEKPQITIGVKSIKCPVCGEEVKTLQGYHGYIVHQGRCE